MIQISPITLGDIGIQILNNISKYIVNRQSTYDNEDNVMTSFFHGNFTLLPDEPHADPEIGADARVKVILKVLLYFFSFSFMNSFVFLLQ